MRVKLLRIFCFSIFSSLVNTISYIRSEKLLQTFKEIVPFLYLVKSSPTSGDSHDHLPPGVSISSFGFLEMSHLSEMLSVFFTLIGNIYTC